MVAKAEATDRGIEISLPPFDHKTNLFSQALIHSTNRVSERLIIKDAVKEGLLASDPYLAQVRSLLCLPMERNNELIGRLFLEHSITQLSVDAADVLLLSADHQVLEYGAGAGFQTANIEKSQVRLGEGRAGAAALERRIVSLPDLGQVQDTFSRVNLLGSENFVSHIVAPRITKEQLKGVLEVFHRQRLDPTDEWFDFFTAMATQAAIAIGNANLFSDLQLSNRELIQAYHATIEGWAHAIDLRDKETVGHTRRVTELTLHLAQAMGVMGSVLVNMQRGAILHDIGKMGIRDDILFKWAVEKLFVQEMVHLKKGAPLSKDFQMASQITKGYSPIKKRTIIVSQALNDYPDWPYVAQVFRLEREVWYDYGKR